MKKLLTYAVGFAALIIFPSVGQAGQQNWRQLYNSSQDNFRGGKLQQSLALARESVKQSEIEFGTKSVYTIRSLILLGDLSRRTGSFTDSFRQHKRALEIQEQIFGELHPNTAKLINELAKDELLMGNTEEARTLFNRSIRICNQINNPENPAVADSLIGLSKLDSMARDYSQAEKRLMTAMSILDSYSKYHPGTRLDIENARLSLADSLKAQGRHSECCMQYRVAVRYLETRGESSSNLVCDSWIAMGDSYAGSGKKARAIDCYKRALAILGSGSSVNNLSLALASRRLAGVYRSAGNIPEARRYYRQAVSSLEMCSPAGCPLLADTKRLLDDVTTTTNSSKDRDSSA